MLVNVINVILERLLATTYINCDWVLVYACAERTGELHRTLTSDRESISVEKYFPQSRFWFACSKHFDTRGWGTLGISIIVNYGKIFVQIFSEISLQQRRQDWLVEKYCPTRSRFV